MPHGARLMLPTLPTPLHGAVDMMIFGGSAVAAGAGTAFASGSAGVDWQGLSGFVLALGGLATAVGGLWVRITGLEQTAARAKEDVGRAKLEADAKISLAKAEAAREIETLKAEVLRVRQNVHAVRNDQQAMMLEVASNSSLLKNNPLNVNVVNPSDHPIPVVTPDPGGERAD